MRRIWLAIIVLALLASACGGSDDETPVVADGGTDSTDGSDDSSGDDDNDADGSSASTTNNDDDAGDDDGDGDEPVDTDFSGSGSGDFCETAREYEENDPLEDLGVFDGEEFFDAVDELWNGLLPDVPGEIRPDVETIIAGFADMRAIAEKYDYDFFNADAAADLDALDTSAMDDATDRFSAYLEDVCGISLFDEDDIGSDPTVDPGDLDLSGDEAAISASLIAQIFGLDMETAECLVAELGDITDPSVASTGLNDPICGTTLAEVFAGAG